MDDGRYERFAVAVGALFVTCGVDATEARLRAYWIGLGDLPMSSIEGACNRAIREAKRLPVPAELRELAGVARPDDAAIEAWRVVEKASALGSYRSVDFSDGLINATIRSLGGWPAILARSPEEFDKWVRRDFLATYGAFARTGVSAEAKAPLPGLSQAGDVRRVDGTLSDWSPPKPVRIESDGLPRLPGIAKVERDKAAPDADVRVERLRLVSLRKVPGVDAPERDPRASRDLREARM